jgi:NAD(P)-dependent dehydrogenase (short-subunit alcohol dehydrogenase family)
MSELDVVFQTTDVTDPVSIGGLVNFIDDRFGRVDVLINNAGIMLENLKPGSAPVSVFKASVDTVRTSMETNVYGPLLLSQALKPLMHGNGRIVNVSSGMGQLTDMNGGWPGYRISKTALNALTRILADELKSTNIKVNSMCPGWVRTDMGGPNAERTVEKGAETIVWLATLPDDGPSGGFFRDKRAIPW